MQELQKQPMTAAVQKEMVDTRVKLLLFNARRLTSPVLAETVILLPGQPHKYQVLPDFFLYPS